MSYSVCVCNNFNPPAFSEVPLVRSVLRPNDLLLLPGKRPLDDLLKLDTCHKSSTIQNIETNIMDMH